ncbi:hypothetical protein O3Q51_10525 [Cryomorphaceae bacterium 1068]|nr:hypothetical protein [Cryomorphaceae bacterium 1068]
MIRKAGLFFFLAIFVGCTTVSDDEVDPVITSLVLNDNSFSPGETLQVSVSGRDNEELGQVRSRIREAFAKSFGFWEFVEVRDLSGSTFTANFLYPVPDSALAGLYEISIQVSDERGNGSVDSTLQFLVRQMGEEPMIIDFDTNPSLGADEVLRIGESDTLTFSGMVSDPDTLDSFSITFKDELGLTLLSLNYALPDTTLFDLTSAPDTVFFESLEVFPVEMELKAQDFIGHQRRETYSIEVD